MQRSTRMLLAGIVVFAAVLRFATLDVQSYWFDEAVTVKLLRDDLGGLLSAIPDSESTPPLYYVLAWLWSKLFGTGEVGLRSLSAVFGVATVPVAYAVAARWLRSDRIALVAAALVAANPLLVWYSQEARAYALLVLVSAATLVVLPEALERGRGRSLAVWALLSALALATHYFALFLIIPEAIWLLRRHRRDAFGAVAGVGVAGLALLPLAVHQAENDGARFIRESSFASRLVQIPKQMLVGYDAPLEVIASVVALLVAALGVVFVVTRATDDERRGALSLAALGGASIAIPLVLSVTGADYLITRNVIVAVVPLLAALAVGFATVRAGAAGLTAAGVLVAIGLGYYIAVAVDDRYQRDNWRKAAEALGPARGNRVIVVTPFNGRVPLEVYLPGVRQTKRGPVPETVDEIDVIAGSPRRVGEGTEPVRAPSRPPPDGFRVVRRVEDDTFTLVVYRADQPIPVATDRIAQLALAPDPDLATDVPGR